MPTPDICQNAKASLEQVRPLKQAFDDSFSRALTSGLSDDVRLAQEHKQTFLKKMAEVRMQMHAWEKETVQTHEEAIRASLVRKEETKEPLTKFELFVLYEMYTTTLLEIELIDWRAVRNHEDDLSIMFDEFYEIARSLDEITPETRIYIGKVDEPNFFQKIPDTLELIYTEFAEKRIRRYDIKIGGKDETELKALVEHSGFKIYRYAESMMEHDDFKSSLREPDPAESDWTKWKLKTSEEAKLIRLRVEDLGFPSGATTDQIYTRAEELGLELCPPEVGPQFRLQYANQPMHEYVYVGMKQISDSDGSPSIFSVARDDVGSWLYRDWATPTGKWRAKREFVFRLRKPAHHSVSEGEKPTM